jgi:hypothetical protein
VKDPSPDAAEFPELHKIITSTVPQDYDGSTFLSRLISSTPDSHDPSSPSFDSEIAGRNAHNDDYPAVPRIKVLSVEQAELVIPSFETRRYDDGLTSELGEDIVPLSREGLLESQVKIFEGTTVRTTPFAGLACI